MLTKLQVWETLKSVQALIIMCVLGFCWILYFVNLALRKFFAVSPRISCIQFHLLTENKLVADGSLKPRQLFIPYFAVLWSPLLHDSFFVLLTNSVFFAIAGGLLMHRGINTFSLASAIIAWGTGVRCVTCVHHISLSTSQLTRQERWSGLWAPQTRPTSACRI